jgi:hypothetical protein
MVPTHMRIDIPWRREPTRDQWLAWVASRLAWTLDAFDFTIFLLLLIALATEFHYSTAPQDLSSNPTLTDPLCRLGGQRAQKNQGKEVETWGNVRLATVVQQ